MSENRKSKCYRFSNQEKVPTDLFDEAINNCDRTTYPNDPTVLSRNHPNNAASFTMSNSRSVQTQCSYSDKSIQSVQNMFTKMIQCKFVPSQTDKCNQCCLIMLNKQCYTDMARSDTSDIIENLPPQLIPLVQDKMLQKCVNNLTENNQLDQLINLLTVLVDGHLVTSNIAWKSTLYGGLWSSCAYTHRMHFNEEFIHFWSLIHIMVGASTLNVLREPVHFGKVVEELTAKNHYDPVNAECNFAIPLNKTLSKMNTGYPKEVPCGMIKHTLDMAEDLARDGKQFTMSFDGKLLAQGCFG